MSVYEELNGLKLDLSAYEEEPPAQGERDAWERRVRERLDVSRQSDAASRARTRRRSAGRWMAAAAALLLAGAAMAYSPSTLAKLPWAAGLLENFGGTSGGQDADYSSYKTRIGETAENEYGKLTLNEVIVDADRLLISSTLEPAKGFDFDYQTFLLADVTIDGREDLQLTTGGQSLEEDDGSYTIYGEVNLGGIPAGEGDALRIKIDYDTITRHVLLGDGRTAIDQPWTFEIEASAQSLTADTRTIELGGVMPLATGERIEGLRAILSPVSTLLYYRIAGEAGEADVDEGSFISFKLTDDTGAEIHFMEGGNYEGQAYPGEGWHYARYPALDPDKHAYTLTPYRYLDGEPRAVGDPIPLYE